MKRKHVGITLIVIGSFFALLSISSIFSIAKDLSLWPVSVGLIGATVLFLYFGLRNVKKHALLFNSVRGEKTQSTNPPTKVGFTILGIMLVLIFLLVRACIRPDTPEQKAAKEKERRESYAMTITRMHVLNKLVSPGSAEFLDRRVTPYGDSTYMVEGIVESKNRMGVPLRADFICTLEYLGGDVSEPAHWNVIRLSVQER